VSYKDLCTDDQEVLRQLLSRPGRRIDFLCRLIAHMGPTEDVDYHVMQLLGPPRSNVVPFRRRGTPK